MQTWLNGYSVARRPGKERALEKTNKHYFLTRKNQGFLQPVQYYTVIFIATLLLTKCKSPARWNTSRKIEVRLFINR